MFLILTNNINMKQGLISSPKTFIKGLRNTISVYLKQTKKKIFLSWFPSNCSLEKVLNHHWILNMNFAFIAKVKGRIRKSFAHFGNHRITQGIGNKAWYVIEFNSLAKTIHLSSQVYSQEGYLRMHRHCSESCWKLFQRFQIKRWATSCVTYTEAGLGFIYSLKPLWYKRISSCFTHLVVCCWESWVRMGSSQPNNFDYFLPIAVHSHCWK